MPPLRAKKKPQPQDQLQPFWTTTDGETVRLYQGDVLDVLRRLPAKSVQCVVTSPPYWGLRDYGTGTWEGGDPNCKHLANRIAKREADKATEAVRGTDGNFQRLLERASGENSPTVGSVCKTCGARRVNDHQLGSEERPDCLGWARGENCAERDWATGCHVCRMVLVFRELRRVLRDDGTLWLNYGDTYASGNSGGNIGGTIRPADHIGDAHRMIGSSTKTGLPSGNLVGVPWRVALALQADGWVLRQDICWSKPSPMPESVRNRCTKAHEYVFLLTNGMRYYYDAEAIKERTDTEVTEEEYASLIQQERDRGEDWYQRVDGRKDTNGTGLKSGKKQGGISPPGGRNKRSVWTVASQGYPGAHFATFPPKLIEPMILAGTSELGCCPRCGAPWERIVVETGGQRVEQKGERDRSLPSNRNGITGSLDGTPRDRVDAGWSPGCSCAVGSVKSCTVLDPFMGSGTTAGVCIGLGRLCWGIELSEQYLVNHATRRVEEALRSRPYGSALVRPVRGRVSVADPDPERVEL